MDIQNGPRSHESFREMDLNDDWKLSREEVWNSSELLFLMYHELICICFSVGICYPHSVCALQVKEYLKKEFQKHGYSPNDTHHEVMVEDIFKNEDEDEDGFITVREFVYQHDEL